MTSLRLTDAVAALRAAASSAGLDMREVDAEGAAVAACVCADAPHAASAWAMQFVDADTTFASAAARGRSWDSQPTPILTDLLQNRGRDVASSYAMAIANVAIEACSLDPDPSLDSINRAGLVARTQLSAAGVTQMPAIGPTESAPPQVAPASAAAATTDGKPAPTLAELLVKLDALIGLKTVKEQVHRQVALLRVNQLRAAKGLKAAEVSRHLVFVGNPGTGKTTVARLVAAIYRALGILEKGTLIETDRSGLVAGYLGQTAIKTSDVIKSALGGILFIDEAYSLAGDEYSDEAIATLVKAMEDHRDDLVVIVAGYTDEMAAFIASNPGLESRFGTTIEFPDYSDDELVEIFESMCKDADFSPTDGCVTKLRTRLKAAARDKGFGNGRFVRNLFEHSLERQAWRLRTNDSPSVDELRKLRADDLPDNDES